MPVGVPARGMALLLLLLHPAPASEAAEPELDTDADADDFRLECMRGTGVDMLSASSLPHPT